MNIFDEYTRDVVIALNKSNVKYLVVGGYAVNFHGYHRTTGDIDLWIEPTDENKTKILNALTLLEIDKDMIQLIATLDFSKPVVFSDGKIPFKIDFMTHVSHVSFNDAQIKKIDALIDEIPISFIHLNELFLSKFNTGRPKDKIDIEELQRIQKYKK